MNELSAEQTARLLAHVGVDPGGAVAVPLGAGHIHRTYRVRGPAGSVVLQQINRTVFPDTAALAANTDRIVEALTAAATRGEYSLEVATPIRGDRAGALFDADGESWRVSRFIEGAYAVGEVDSAQRARLGAGAFGEFCAALAAIDPATLVDLLPRFHDLGHRLDQLETVAGRDSQGRLAEVRSEFDQCLAQRRFAQEIEREQATLPRRVCHNDTKIDNLLFDELDHRPRAVIDLDTCMPGWWMHDFGDIVRTFCSPEAEDSTRLERVTVRADTLADVAVAFTAPLAGLLTDEERASLWSGALAICLVVGVRFLTDHLDGDRYFAVSRAGQNLDRARNQLALYDDLVARENELRPMLEKIEDRRK